MNNPVCDWKLQQGTSGAVTGGVECLVFSRG